MVPGGRSNLALQSNATAIIQVAETNDGCLVVEQVVEPGAIRHTSRGSPRQLRDGFQKVHPCMELVCMARITVNLIFSSWAFNMHTTQ